MTPEEFLKSRGVCIHCHQNHASCVAQAPDDYGRHDEVWRAHQGITLRRPWWTNAELVRIIQNADKLKLG